MRDETPMVVPSPEAVEAADIARRTCSSVFSMDKTRAAIGAFIATDLPAVRAEVRRELLDEIAQRGPDQAVTDLLYTEARRAGRDEALTEVQERFGCFADRLEEWVRDTNEDEESHFGEQGRKLGVRANEKLYAAREIRALLGSFDSDRVLVDTEGERHLGVVDTPASRISWPYGLTPAEVEAENVGEFFEKEVTTAREYLERGHGFMNNRDEGLLAAGICAAVISILMGREGFEGEENIQIRYPANERGPEGSSIDQCPTCGSDDLARHDHPCDDSKYGGADPFHSPPVSVVTDECPHPGGKVPCGCHPPGVDTEGRDARLAAAEKLANAVEQFGMSDRAVQTELEGPMSAALAEFRASDTEGQVDDV